MSLHDGVADLHLHTVTSDGTDTITKRIKQARQQDLSTIAITDHDRIADELSAGSTTRNGIEIITGVEIRADAHDTKVELLGYFVDPNNGVLMDVLERARRYRRERNRALVANLNESTKLNLDYKELTNSVRGGLGRPHLANILIDNDIVNDIGAAFEEYLAEGGHCFVPMERVAYSEVLNAIHAAGGVASLAHPGRIRHDNVETIVETLADAGLDAIETYYPYDSETTFEIADAVMLAEEFDLLQSGGSDCHGRKSGKFRIGSVCVDRTTVTALAAKAD